MQKLQQLFDNNRAWAARVKATDPDFFSRLAAQQRPDYLWIGCSDSRVPANQVIGLIPGQIFVHRNVANVVVHTDLNCLSAMQYSVAVLGIKHIIVCGHYGCGGVHAALADLKLGLIDNWLRHVQDVIERHDWLYDLPEDETRLDALCELNVIEQVINVCQTTIVQNAWEHGQELSVQGLIYSLNDGLLRDLNMGITNRLELRVVYQKAVAECRATALGEIITQADSLL